MHILDCSQTNKLVWQTICAVGMNRDNTAMKTLVQQCLLHENSAPSCTDDQLSNVLQDSNKFPNKRLSLKTLKTRTACAHEQAGRTLHQPALLMLMNGKHLR